MSYEEPTMDVVVAEEVDVITVSTPGLLEPTI